ncbi:hypothetical protein [Chitinimonas sp. BJYL2]|uniref:hypothetical protein n=1 Tax=Chitinimonas sp. BJYL2 TaxID=2976696 RepID=UPI0022B3DE5D|nr:hypothetical protein [Chitinimonas sp. BJYL2]
MTTQLPIHQSPAVSLPLSGSRERHWTGQGHAALMIVDADCRIVHTNVAASLLLHGGSGMVMRDQRLAVADLGTALGVAVANASGRLGPMHPSSLRLSQLHARLICLPLPPTWREQASCTGQHALLLVLGQNHASPDILWRQVYGFNDMECRLANWLLSHHGSSAIQYEWLTGCLRVLQQKTGSLDADSLITELRLCSGMPPMN